MVMALELTVSQIVGFNQLFKFEKKTVFFNSVYLRATHYRIIYWAIPGRVHWSAFRRGQTAGYQQRRRQ